ncbi:hypothetical protein A5727_16975 [Mycobacterium sp. ACS4331]|nr:hypothetical protein A5727_16975 [Mycobacterium sp. ACS4331]
MEVTAVAAAAAAGWLLPALLSNPDPSPSVTAHHAVPGVDAAATPVERIGQVVATAADSITTKTSDGQLITFRITPQTAQIVESGAQFVVNDVIVVQATEQNGTQVATTIADRDLVGQDGPPMDYNLP